MQTNSYLENIHTKSNNQINFLSGGINNVYPPQYIQDDECQDMTNMCFDFYPAISTRVGRSYIGNPGIKGKEVKYFNLAGVKYLFYIQDDELKDMNGTIISTGIKGDRFAHVYYADGNNEYLILYGEGVTPTRHKLPLSPLNTPEIMPLPEGVTSFEHMCYHKNRMFGSNGNMLYFSALQNPMDWKTTENSREDRVPNCNQITGLVSFDDKLIVFSEKNMHLYYGSNVISGQADSYTCVSLDNDIGCYDQCTIKVHNSYLYWLYGRSIYEYDGSTIRNIEKPTGNNGLTGGIAKKIENITINDAKNVSVAASENKIYFWFSNTIQMFVFDQRLRKWAEEILDLSNMEDGYYKMICDSYADLNFSQTPSPIYALTNSGVIYELTGGRKIETEGYTYYTRFYGKDQVIDNEGNLVENDIAFLLTTKEFKNGTLSKKKSLSSLWLNYDLDGYVDIIIDTDNGKRFSKIKALPEGKNLTQRILIPNDMQNAYSYTFSFAGKGNFKIYAMEREDRTHNR